MWGFCGCGHHKADHPWIGRGPYGSTSGYGGCELCWLCDKPSKEHDFALHQFKRCACTEYQESA